MCGIAGYSLSARSDVDRTLAAQALLAGIAERGADAVGYAYRRPGETPPTVDEAAHAGEPACSTGSPSPRPRPSCSSTSATTRRAIRRSPPTTTPSATGRWSGSTTGSSSTTTSCSPRSAARARSREMTVDSEAIFALAAHSGQRPARARGRSSARWRPPGSTSAIPAPSSSPAAIGRPLWIGAGRHELFFASTKRRARGRRALRGRPAPQARARRTARFLELRDGGIARSERFRPDRTYRRGRRRCPPCARRTRASSCLARLAALAA